MLVVAGESDAMWPSAEMARALLSRRPERSGDRLVLLPGAGHFLRPPITPTTVDHNDALVSGGTPAATAVAQRESWRAVQTFLTTHLR